MKNTTMKKQTKHMFKFATVAIMIGLFSPSATLEVDTQTAQSYTANSSQFTISVLNKAEARGRRGGGRNRNVNRNRNRNTNVNRNRNTNRNVNRNRNVNVNVNHRGGRYYGGSSRYGYYGGRPVLAFATGLAIGSVVAAASMPTTCTTVVTNGATYRRCGSSYYQPVYQGDTVVYKVVNSPY